MNAQEREAVDTLVWAAQHLIDGVDVYISALEIRDTRWIDRDAGTIHECYDGEEIIERLTGALATVTALPKETT